MKEDKTVLNALYAGFIFILKKICNENERIYQIQISIPMKVKEFF